MVQLTYNRHSEDLDEELEITYYFSRQGPLEREMHAIKTSIKQKPIGSRRKEIVLKNIKKEEWT